MPPTTLNDLLDRAKIGDLVGAYANSIDRRDWAGYRSIFAMVVDIMRGMLDYYRNMEEAQGVVLIDEIETHLHPRWKMQVMTSLRRAFPRVQFIVTTHDPLCLRGMDDDEVVVLQRDRAGRIRRLEDLPSVRGMSAEQLLTSDYFGLSSTTDPKLEKALALLTNDTVSLDADGRRHIELSEETRTLIGNVTIGDSPSEEIVQQAVQRYLNDREIERGGLRTVIRSEAIERILAALKAPLPE